MRPLPCKASATHGLAGPRADAALPVIAELIEGVAEVESAGMPAEGDPDQ